MNLQDKLRFPAIHLGHLLRYDFCCISSRQNLALPYRAGQPVGTAGMSMKTCRWCRC
jgi:hypothetical protein